jgi:hypothetical protein
LQVGIGLCLVFEMDQEPCRLSAESSFDQEIARPLPSVDRKQFFVNKFKDCEVDESCRIGDERFKETLQDGGRSEQHFEKRIVIHGDIPMRLLFRSHRPHFQEMW